MPLVLICVAVAALLALSAWFIFGANSVEKEPQLTDRIALGVLNPELFAECLQGGIPESYRSCVTEIYEEGEGWRVRVTYDGLYDDSIKASRVEAYIVNENGEWKASDIRSTNQCHAGRGHQDFSTELCV